MFKRRHGIPTPLVVVFFPAVVLCLWSVLPRSLQDRIVPVAYATTFTVNSAADSDDGNCNAADCTLREAINAVNAGAGGDTISFNIVGAGVRTINLTSALPPISKSVTIDGASQPGFSGTPLIELNGAGAGGSANGLVLNAGTINVRSLIINRFGGYGIDVETSASAGITG